MRAKWSVFVFFLALYLLTAGGHTYSTDEESMFFVTAAMARRGGFDTPSMQEAPVSAPMRGIDGKLYAPYGLLPSALALPFYHVGAIVSSFLPRIYQGYFLRFAITFFLNPFFTALTAVLLLEAILVLGYSFRVALVTTFLFGLGTMAWVYAKTFFSEPLLTLLWVGAFLALIKYHK
ncbi:MAG TPA: hypothetical protein VFD70_26835, partial [Anaerolineae bacterium]|nr:hypothetical protein [Anaerolineae bacterium]